VNPALWDKEVTKDTLTTELASTSVLMFMSDPYNARATGQTLFDEFLIEFEHWDHDMFTAIDKHWKKELRIYLRQRFIYTGPPKGALPRQLANLLTLEECPEWPEGAAPAGPSRFSPRQQGEPPAQATTFRVGQNIVESVEHHTPEQGS
jgi:hypothetical protein